MGILFLFFKKSFKRFCKKSGVILFFILGQSIGEECKQIKKMPLKHDFHCLERKENILIVLKSAEMR